jgi:hypothetical protein
MITLSYARDRKVHLIVHMYRDYNNKNDSGIAGLFLCYFYIFI